MSEKNEEDEKEDGDERLLKAISLTPVITALFRPTAELLGQELCEFVRSKIEVLKKSKREENLVTHLKNVQERLKAEPLGPTTGEVTFARLVIFEEWSEHVQGIDAADAELGSIWDGLLAAAARGEDVSSEVVLALKSLTPAEAVLLLQMNDVHAARTPRVGEERDRIAFLRRGLYEKRLIERGVDVLGTVGLLFGAVVCVVFIFLWMFRSEEQKALWPMVIATLVGLAIGALTIQLQQWQLTWLGRKVSSYARLKRGISP